MLSTANSCLQNSVIHGNLIVCNLYKEARKTMGKYDALKLENQLCFPLYACSKEIVRRYTPFLDEIGLTYTQYIVMLVMWEHEAINVKELGKYLYLDSGTLTPVLKKLEQKGYLTRARSAKDERVLDVTLTESGIALKEKALAIPSQIGACVNLQLEEAVQLHGLLKKVLGSFE